MHCRECKNIGYCAWCRGTGREGLGCPCRSCRGSGMCLSCDTMKVKGLVVKAHLPSRSGDCSPQINSVEISPNRATIEEYESIRLKAIAKDENGDALADASFDTSWSVGSENVAQVIPDKQIALVESLEIGNTSIIVTSGRQRATANIESVAPFTGEWVGEQTSVLDDGRTEVRPICIRLATRNRRGRYVGNYCWLSPEMDPCILLAGLRIDGVVSGNSMTFTVPSPHEAGHGRMTLSGNCLKGELIMPNEPKQTFRASRKEDQKVSQCLMAANNCSTTKIRFQLPKASHIVL